MRTYFISDNCELSTTAAFPAVTDGGNPFTDAGLSVNVHITAVTIWDDSSRFAIRLTYWLAQAPVSSSKHGVAVTGTETTINMQPGEIIHRVTGNNDNPHENKITFFTNQKRVLGPYGKVDISDNYDVSGTELLFLSGRSGGAIDQLSFTFTTTCKYASL